MQPSNLLRIDTLTEESFRPYGEIISPGSGNLFIDYPDGSAFYVLAKARSQGWRLAMLKLRTRIIEGLQMHRTTSETLHPVQGVAVLCVNTRPSRDGLRAFILDRPVLIPAGIWHNILTLSEESMIEIAENDEVDSEEVELDGRLTAALSVER